SRSTACSPTRSGPAGAPGPRARAGSDAGVPSPALAQPPERGRGVAGVLVDRELRAERAVPIVEPALVSRPLVDARVDRLVCPVGVPWPHPGHPLSLSGR